ncbi:NAD(P)-dependent oxidoreductase [Myxococcota bacterium]|nr:NAD(P)-dependent oxidoreductase [Myxococcota bacterium]
MNHRILITGSCGLVGCGLRAALERTGTTVVGLDLQGLGAEAGDVRDADRVRASVEGCTGVVHLAAVSRVIWGERDPALCWSTNVGGLRTVIDAAVTQPIRPWLIFASSREVYGQPGHLPVAEDAPLAPVNVYGRSKVAGETLVLEARETGLRTAVVRLSNVYGSTTDHADRVLPAFARAAVRGEPLRVDGAGHTFDFTHIDDVSSGLLALARVLQRGDQPPPIHLLTGRPTSLGQAASLAIELARSQSTVVEAPPRAYDVATFYGDPGRARALLGWNAQVSLAEGMSRLINDFRAEQTA